MRLFLGGGERLLLIIGILQHLSPKNLNNTLINMNIFEGHIHTCFIVYGVITPIGD